MSSGDTKTEYEKARDDLSADLTLLNLIQAAMTDQTLPRNVRVELASAKRYAEGAVLRSVGGYQNESHHANIKPPAE